MSYIVEQKIKGRIYLYEVESYWDKSKKQPRQRRKYIGPKNAQNRPKIKQRPSYLLSRNYGNILLLDFIANKLGITELLKTFFPEFYFEILALAYFEIMESSALYLFPYWIDEQFLPNTKKLYSSGISNLCETIGRSQKQRSGFIKQWIEKLCPITGIYYDITSISSYSTNIDFIEWGYNRDHENLPQLNMGVVFCQNNLLPILYNLYPGSIVDVSTLKNCIRYLNNYNLKNLLFILDRGFFSKSNILELNKETNHAKFIQPLPFKLKKVKELLRKNRRYIKNSMNSFKYKEEVLFYLKDYLEFDGNTFDAHIYFNEKAEVHQKHIFLSSLLTIEDKFKNQQFNTLKEYKIYKESKIPKKYRDYFKWNKKTLIIEKHIRIINQYLCSMGYFILLTNNKDMDKVNVLDHYRRRDGVEKLFDIVKNEMDGDRLRSHSSFSTEGRLFIKFIALILYSEISKIMNEKKLFEKYSVKELMCELKKLKITIMEGSNPIIGEMTKKQKIIFKDFGILETIVQHSY